MPDVPIEDLLPPLQERIVCSVSAAAKYQVPANIILAIAEKEGGRPGQWKSNQNGTHDVGQMQFNTSYLRDLMRYGITVNDVARAGCYSFDLAAWRLRQHLRKDKGDLWTRAANYHSHTPQHNRVYRVDLMRKAAKWADWLDARFVTYYIVRPSTTQPTANIAKEAKHQSTLHPKAGLVAELENKNLHSPKTSYVPRSLVTNKYFAEKP